MTSEEIMNDCHNVSQSTVVPPVIWMLSKIIFDNKNVQRTKLPKPLDGGEVFTLWKLEEKLTNQKLAPTTHDTV